MYKLAYIALIISGVTLGYSIPSGDFTTIAQCICIEILCFVALSNEKEKLEKY